MDPPPALSTTQDTHTFEYAQHNTKHIKREYLREGPLEESIAEYYEISALRELVKPYKRVTLQFPDTLIQDGGIVVDQLQRGVDTPEFWMLADTAYSSCCVDEVAAQHVDADVVVHMGNACLNAVQTLPVIYVFGRPMLDTAKIVELIAKQYEPQTRICLDSSFPYMHHLGTLDEKLRDRGFSHICFTGINDDYLKDTNAQVLGSIRSNAPQVLTWGNKVLHSHTEEKIMPEDLSSLTMIHITIPEPPQLLHMTTMFESLTVYDLRNEVFVDGPFPSLNKRYRNMHIARTAGCIGILINTLSLRNTRTLINELIKLIRLKDKKHYLFVVGKPNVAKLANFEAVDVWVVLGCGQGGIIVDQNNEFYKPIVTPYELTLALRMEPTWTGSWIVDFNRALEEIDDLMQETDPNSQSDAPEFDAVTGKVVSTSRPLRTLQHLQIESPVNSVISTSTQDSVIKGTVSTSLRQLQSRQWTGLGSDYHLQSYHDDEGAELEEGDSGIARGYDHDKRVA